MKPAGLLLLIAAGLVASAAAGETTRGLASREIKAHIRESLPKYQPTPPQTDRTTDSTPVTATDLLVLPKMIVKEFRLPRDAADHLIRKRDFKRKMQNIYLDTLAEAGPLNVILNRFSIPILSPSGFERGREIYRAREMERLERVNEIGRTLDPATAGKFKREMDNTHTTRPAGIK